MVEANVRDVRYGHMTRLLGTALKYAGIAAAVYGASRPEFSEGTVLAGGIFYLLGDTLANVVNLEHRENIASVLEETIENVASAPKDKLIKQQSPSR